MKKILEGILAVVILTIGCVVLIHYSKGLSQDPFNIKSAEFPEWKIKVLPEFIRALDAATPKIKGCEKVRYKWVPVQEVQVNGKTLSGKYALTYRGYCHYHWMYQQKSFKLKVINGEKLLGYRTLNFNSLNSDPGFFEVFGSMVLKELNIPHVSSAVSLVAVNDSPLKLTIVTQGMNNEMLNWNGLPNGNIYRENSRAILGRHRGPSWWKKTTYENEPRTDWNVFENTINHAMKNKNLTFFPYLDVESYVKYTAITNVIGSDHFYDHNVVVYRPRKGSKFQFIVNDLGESYLSRRAKDHNHLNYIFHIMHPLSKMMWTMDRFRHDVFLTMSSFLKLSPSWTKWYSSFLDDLYPVVEQQFHNGLVLDAHDVTPANFSKDKYLELTQWPALKSRFPHLRSRFLDPQIYLNPGWQKQSTFQGLLSGAGRFRLQIVPPTSDCVGKTEVQVRSNDRWEKVAFCNAGKWQTRGLTLEETTTAWPAGPNDTGSERSGMGSMYLEFQVTDSVSREENPFDIVIRSETLGKELSIKENWPFRVFATQPGEFALKAEDELFASGEVYWFHPEPTYLTIKDSNENYTIQPHDFPQAFWDAYANPYDRVPGPLLCWRTSREECVEFSKDFVIKFGFLKASEFFKNPNLSANTKERLITPSSWQDKEVITLTRGTHLIDEPLMIRKDQTIVFLPGADLAFADKASLVIRGNARFPGTPPAVRFRGRNAPWAGVILDGQESVTVRHAEFRDGQEFFWGESRYSGALTVKNVKKFVIENSAFIDNTGDDGINILDSQGMIRNNTFENNRDGIDVDRSQAIITNNFVKNTIDDGIDVGEKAEVTITENRLCHAGDKGISVGEGSQTVVSNNLIYGNNVGIAVKDGSKATLENNEFIANEIAVSSYEKFTSDKPHVTGTSGFSKNKTNLQGNPQLRDSFQVNPIAKPKSDCQIH